MFSRLFCLLCFSFMLVSCGEKVTTTEVQFRWNNTSKTYEQVSTKTSDKNTKTV